MTSARNSPAAIGPFVVLSKIGEGSMGIVYAGYDVGLDRKVALKLVQSKFVGKQKIRERMMREAKALARLSSPYVVQVYQVGEHDNGIYLAMEYVEGEDLRSWFNREHVSWRDILGVLCDAGRGLAAAHSAGLVHRDFKPENVLVGTDGRARVLDFGLVIHEGEDDLMESGEGPIVGAAVDHMPLYSTMRAEEVPPSNPTTPRSATAAESAARRPRLRRVAGTPAYMSPEQHFGGAVGPYSDLFSFSITLYEALYGFRPFEGDTWKQIQEKVKGSLIPAPPVDSPVPRRIHRIILRGLSFYHEDRWPSVEAMVKALEHDPRRARLRAVGLASLVVAASAGSYALAMNQLGGAQVCEGVETELQGVWGEERKRAVHDAFTATGAAFAEDSWRRVELRLDAYAGAWVDGRRAICGADAKGSLSEGILEARMGCIARRRAYLATLVDVLGAADQDVVQNAVQAVASLPSVATCADVDLLLSETRRPDDPETAQRVEALRVQLSRAEVLESTGLYDDAETIVSAVREEARGLGFGPLEAEAGLREGSLRVVSGRIGEASEVLNDALEKALVHDLHAVAAEAAAKRIFALGEGERLVTEALAGAPVARALVARARGDWRLSALLNNNLGTVYLVGRDIDNAVLYFEKTIATIPAEVGGAEPLLGVSHHNLGNAYLARDEFDEAASHYRESVSAMAEALGENHPMVAHPMAGLGDVALSLGAYDEAEGHYEEALATMQAAYGAGSLYVVQPLAGLGEVALRRGRIEEAQARFERVVAVSAEHNSELDYLAASLVGLGEIAVLAEDYAGALARFERALAVREATGADVEEIADVALLAGAAADGAGDPKGAAAWYERVLLLGELDPKAPQRARAAFAIAASLGPGERARACALVEMVDVVEAGQAGTFSEDERAQAARLRAKACR